MLKKLRPSFMKECRGSILLFTLIILLLVSLMGIAILQSNRSAPTTLSDSGLSDRKAFLRADAAAGISALLSRIMLNPGLGEPADYLNNDGSLTVTFKNDFDLAALKREAVRSGRHVQKPSLKILAGSETGDEYHPHIFFWQGRELIATAVISIAPGSPVSPGMSLSETDYAASGGASSSLAIIITVNGQSSVEMHEGLDGGDNGPQSLITTIFREVL